MDPSSWNWQLVGVWVGVGLTLIMYSFLYKDNPFFRFGEHLYLGVSVGYLFVIAIFKGLHQSLWVPTFVPWLHSLKGGGGPDWWQRYLRWTTEGFTPAQLEAAPKWWLLVGLVLGIIVYLRLSARLSWVSRYTFAFLVGWGSGIVIPVIIEANILKQIHGTVSPLLEWGTMGWFEKWSQILILVGVICTLIYFLFSVEHKGPVRVMSKIGIYFLMISFGASFGMTVMGRMALLVGRLQYLIDRADSGSYFATYAWLWIAVGGIAAWELLRKRTPAEGGAH